MCHEGKWLLASASDRVAGKCIEPLNTHRSPTGVRSPLKSPGENADHRQMSLDRRAFSTVVVGSLIVMILLAGILSALAFDTRVPAHGLVRAAGRDAIAVAADATTTTTAA